MIHLSAIVLWLTNKLTSASSQQRQFILFSVAISVLTGKIQIALAGFRAMCHSAGYDLR
jgi:hypothetical protein